MKTGISIYLSSGPEKNEEVIHKAHAAGVTYGFTSLHIPEEEYSDYKEKVIHLLKLCSCAGISLSVDVDNETPSRLGIAKMEDLLQYGVSSIRLDYGFTDSEVVELSKNFHIVWNASAVTLADIRKWEKLGADVSKFTACHNYYPKPYTGLSLSRVKEINAGLKAYGFETEAFVPGDKDFRGPLYEGLPTVEDHRNCKEDLCVNMLELYQAYSDIVLVGDVDLSEEGWSSLKSLSRDVIPLRADFYEEFDDIAQSIRGRVSHERPDSSEYVIRSCESRSWFKDMTIQPQNTIECRSGSICISNDGYLRYKGEVEICRLKRPADNRVNVIGRIKDKDIRLIPYIKNEAAFVIT